MNHFQVIKGKVLLNGKSYSELMFNDKEHYDMKVRIERTKTIRISESTLGRLGGQSKTLSTPKN